MILSKAQKISIIIITYDSESSTGQNYSLHTLGFFDSFHDIFYSLHSRGNDLTFISWRTHRQWTSCMNDIGASFNSTVRKYKSERLQL